VILLRGSAVIRHLYSAVATRGAQSGMGAAVGRAAAAILIAIFR
jgi:hypothetical protein